MNKICVSDTEEENKGFDDHGVKPRAWSLYRNEVILEEIYIGSIGKYIMYMPYSEQLFF